MKSNFDRTPLDPGRIRHIQGSFAFIPHRFLRDGFWASLEHDELLLYFLLAVVADRQGMSFYHDDRLASILRFVLDRFVKARAGLIRKNLLSLDPKGQRYQLLALPPSPKLSIPQPDPTGTQPPQPPDSPGGNPPQHIRNALLQLLLPNEPHR